MVFSAESTKAPFTAWVEKSNRCFSIEVDGEAPDRADKETIATTREAASNLLSLPWEIMHDGTVYLDHRASAMPLIQAMENLGQGLVKVDILHQSTFMGCMTHKWDWALCVLNIFELTFLTILSTLPIYVKNTRIEILVGFTRRRVGI